jgi:hypothetical protein
MSDKLEKLKSVERVHVITPEIFGDVVRADDYDAALAALEDKDQQLTRYSVSPGMADQRICESNAVRVALGFAEDAIDIAPVDLVEAIQAITQRAEAAERSCQDYKELSEYLTTLKIDTTSSTNQFAFNPVANFGDEPSFLMKFMQEAYGKKLSDLEYLRAKEIAIDVCHKNEVPKLITLVEAWKTEPMLIDFAESIARSMLYNR